jgi:formate hydrogenlyase subunit 3/multisubunit Na+/H+ antiporter MnhD subunit
VLFLGAGIALLRFGVRNVNELSRLRGRAPWTAAAMTIAGLSLIGIPPLSGFFGKWYVLNATIADGRYALTAALVIGSVASVGYVFRILEQLYFTTAPEPAAAGTNRTTARTAALPHAGSPAAGSGTAAAAAGGDGYAAATATAIAPPPATINGLAWADVREGNGYVVTACVVLAIFVILFGVINERVVSLIIMPALPAVLP